MENPILSISLLKLSFAFIPVIIVILFFIKWSLDYKSIIYSLIRMLGQLLIVGYLLIFIFQTENSLLILFIMSIMIFASSWISLRTVRSYRKELLFIAFISIFTGGGITLIIISQGVLNLDPWFLPRYLIPLAGMVFANAMNSVSLAAERLYSEMKKSDGDFKKARYMAYNASLIPIINSFFAVGIVSLPGMMTGQILSGISPLVAVRYQIMVMCMIFGSAGISSFLFLKIVEPHFKLKST